MPSPTCAIASAVRFARAGRCRVAVQATGHGVARVAGAKYAFVGFFDATVALLRGAVHHHDRVGRTSGRAAAVSEHLEGGPRGLPGCIGPRSRGTTGAGRDEALRLAEPIGLVVGGLAAPVSR